MSGFILAIDQGTTSSRAIVFDGGMKAIATGQKEFPQHYPDSGWVEHDPEDIWKSVVSTVRSALRKAKIGAGDVAALGITNQRETIVVWEKETGKPIHNAIVWQDRRTAPLCEKLKKKGLEALFSRKTGLLLDPYFSGTKLAWILDHVKGARRRAEKGEILAGTIDSFLIWRLTGGAVHATDATNASRTLLYNIKTSEWDEELLKLLDVPRAMLPEVRDSADDYGATVSRLFGQAIPIRGVAGDQQAAVIGQACFEPGMLKATYGTGCFAVLNTGEALVRSKNRLLTTIAYRLNGKTTYALEGSIFVAGAAVQWLRDGLKVIGKAAHSGELADKADPNQHLYLVPAFVGLGAPYWDADARGAIFGLTRNSGPAEFARATLESVAYQTHDLLAAMRRDWKDGAEKTVLRVDGGMVASDWTMQCVADMLDAPVDRPTVLETTALGAAWLAGSHTGVWPDAREFSESWSLDRRFLPKMEAVERRSKLKGWRDAVRRTLSRQDA
ncbi:glycerol kinase [Nitratireductor indicus C115]|uniref:Glycerol kinase n=1 Tax=Nitratireductor indicus C115 TaxID=1231190 RepID=K2P942_9HYPH|nr:glycerol kinase GlpK [Nitratireductor indicus]EKF43731.1 glycerol kinase [Nitratireductor indicus C115]SFQ79442.1 glycerol kinase [Nitratireductor indicus]